MSFRVHLNKRTRLFILSLTLSHQERIGKLIDRLGDNPYPPKTKIIAFSSTNFDIKKCKGHQSRLRARIGEYRLIYQVVEARGLVIVLKLDTRGDVY